MISKSLLVKKTVQEDSRVGEWPLQFTGASISMLQNHITMLLSLEQLYATDITFTWHISLSFWDKWYDWQGLHKNQ